MRYIKEFDSLRAIAVIMVMLGHYLSQHYFLRVLSSVGVILFFVLSGFLITQILLQQKEKYNINGLSNIKTTLSVLKAFYIRRTLRIFPLYYLVLIVTVLLNIDTAREYWNYHFFYASNFLYAYKGGFDRLSHFWSLAVEEQFYLFWPILILAIPLKWRNFNFFLLVSLISLLFKIVLAIFLTANNNIVYFLMPSCIESFSLGAAVLMLNKEDISFKKINIVLACSLLVFVLLLFGANSPNYFISFIGKVLGRTVLSVFFAFVLLLIKNGHLSVFFSRMLTLKPVLLLGKISYGIYVYHMFIPSLLVYLQRKFHFDLSGSGFYLLLDFVITFGLSYISYFIFELPINNLKKKFPY